MHTRQTGVTLIEVLVAILILSFGMLSLGAMLGYAVQLPKLSGYRSTAALLAAGHIERMRANSVGFANGFYQETLTYDGTSSVLGLADCAYPICTSSNLANTLATMDKAYTNTRRRDAGQSCHRRWHTQR
jgi:type IV pilus assembly protein PilV